MMLRLLGGAAGAQAAPAGGLQTCMVASALILCPAAAPPHFTATGAMPPLVEASELDGAERACCMGRGVVAGRAPTRQRHCRNLLLVQQCPAAPQPAPKPLGTSPRAVRRALGLH